VALGKVRCVSTTSGYLEVPTLLASFSKSSFSVTTTGDTITAATGLDQSIDTFRTAFLPSSQSSTSQTILPLRGLARMPFHFANNSLHSY